MTSDHDRCDVAQQMILQTISPCENTNGECINHADWSGDKQYGTFTGPTASDAALLREALDKVHIVAKTREVNRKTITPAKSLERIATICEVVFNKAALNAPAAAVCSEAIYVASKSEHAASWRNFRDQGMPIISTWIDEAGIGETQSWSDLWSRCISEAASATGLIVYGQPGEILKGALAEVGAALQAGVPVAVAGNPDGMKNIRKHPGVIGDYRTIEQAYDALRPQPAKFEAAGGKNA